jgi:hypothetical protein
MEVSQTSRPRLSVPRTTLGFLVIVVALLAVGLQSSAGTALLTRLGLVSAPVPFLELSFPNPTQHPQEVTPGEVVPVSFVLNSRGGSYRDVAWQIETIDASGSRVVAAGNQGVSEGASLAISRDVRVTCDGATTTQPRTQVRVSVAEPSQEILFWLTCDLGGSS